MRSMVRDRSTDCTRRSITPCSRRFMKRSASSKNNCQAILRYWASAGAMDMWKSSARPDPAGAADEAGPRRDDDARLQTSRHHHAVRGPQHPRWHRHWPQHAASSPPKSLSASSIRSGASSRGKGDPRRRRQLCDPQAPKVRQWLARHPPRWTFHFTPNLSILAQCGRRLLR